MKKIIFLLIVVVMTYQNWDKIKSKFYPEQLNQQLVAMGTTLYATQSCGYCQKVRELFAEKNVKYREVDIESSSNARTEFEKFGKNGVPLLVINGKLIHGFNEPAIIASVEQLKLK